MELVEWMRERHDWFVLWMVGVWLTGLLVWLLALAVFVRGVVESAL